MGTLQQERTTEKKESEIHEYEIIPPAADCNNSVVPSATSSPSHEFSFTISMHSSGTTSSTTTPTSPSRASTTKNNIAPLAIDLTPADEIFFHGHLLPLHFLSHLHASSPRSSTNSMDNLTLPVRDILHEDRPNNNNNIPEEKTKEGTNESCPTKDNFSHKSKTFSLFGLGKWRKGIDTKEKSEKIRKLKFEVSQFVKRYMRLVKPFLSSKGGRGEDFRVRNQRPSYSFSGSLSPREKLRDNRGFRRHQQFSAPASMRTSPTNSGRLKLVASSGCPSPVSESTMEELQSAIQAAIAHCKKSISVDAKSPGLSSSSSSLSSVPVN